MPNLYASFTLGDPILSPIIFAMPIPALYSNPPDSEPEPPFLPSQTVQKEVVLSPLPYLLVPYPKSLCP